MCQKRYRAGLSCRHINFKNFGAKVISLGTIYESWMSFKNRHVISMKDFSRKEMDYILDTAEKLEPVARGEERSRLLDGKIVALLFF